MSKNSFINIENLYKEYKGKNKLIVFQGLDLLINKGEVHCVFGPTGCGKSTLLNIIAGVDDKYTGKVLINNEKPSIGKIGFIFQDYSSSLFPWLDCTDNITFKYLLNGTKKYKRKEIAKNLLNSLNISLNLDKYPYEYSGGQQQIISLARALCDSPEVLLMDEPFSSLDATTREIVRKKTIEITQNLKLTVILVSHNLEDCVFCGDKITFLSETPAKVITTETIDLNKNKLERNIYSDEFSCVLNNYKTLVKNEQKKI